MFTYIKAHMMRSLRWVAVSVIFFAVLTFYSRYEMHVQMKQREIESAYDNIEVRIELMNISGTSTVDLGIFGNILIPFFKDEFVFAGEKYRGIASYIKEKHLELGILYLFYEGMPGFNSLDAKKLIGVSDVERVYAFQSGTGKSIQYAKGYDDSLFFYVPGERIAPTCVIPDALLNRTFYGEDGERKVRLLIAPHPDPKHSLMLEFIVAGTHNADDETIYCPFILADALFHDLTSASNHDGAAFLKEYMDSTKSYPIMKLDAVSAVIKDNRKIAELEKLLERYYHKVDIHVKQAEQPLFDGNRTVAYTIYDEQLNHTVGLLNKNLRTLRRLYPVFLFLETLMLFTVFYFYFHTRKQAFALSRVLGFSRRMLMAAALIETSIVCAFGAILYIVFAGVVHVYALILGVITSIMATYSSVTLHTRMGRILKIGMREGI